MLEHLLLSFYGDDFTGSTDVMEAFTAAGVPTVLFLEPPNPQDLSRFSQMRYIGIAGQSRGKTRGIFQTTPSRRADSAVQGLLYI
jgi:3-oxoisoapionate kinase